MLISEVITMLESKKKEYGDVSLIQKCSKEGLLMPIRDSSIIRNKITGEVALALYDGWEDYFGELPPISPPEEDD